MSHWDIRSFWRDRRSRRVSVRHAGRAAADLAGSAGGIGLGDAGDRIFGTQ